MILSGIYKIQNKNTGKCYVGSAVNIDRRKKKHFLELRNGIHHSLKLQRSYNKHGIDALKRSWTNATP